MKRHTRFLVPLALVLIVACTSSNNYAAATVAYNQEGATYAANRAAIDSAYSAGRVSAAQYQQYVDIQKAYAAADNVLYADLGAWKASGVQPANYSTDAATRTAAANNLAALAKAVNP